MKKLLFIKLTILSFLFLMTSSLSAFNLYRIDKDIEGRVIDADTKEPLQGVVVQATWHTSMPTPAGSKLKLYDIFETLTDENGDFIIKGQGIKLMTTMESPSIGIFKAGYEDINLHDLGEKFNKYSIYKERVSWEEEKAIIPLYKLTIEERKKRIISAPNPEMPYEKNKYRWVEIYKERIEIGKKPYRLNVKK